MVKETFVRPSELEDVHLEYLDDLRESGITNMYGAPRYLIDTFGLPRDVANKFVTYWMETFSKRQESKDNAQG